MKDNKTYHEIELGKNTYRRDYSKVSGKLELPNLIEVQTKHFEWFKNEGIREVFEDIYPIISNNGNYRLKFVDFSFGEPKYSVRESKYREVNYSAPLRALLELEIVDDETGEVISKPEEVFLGDFPIMTPTGTFIINGAERVIVSQIVRSPGAYFDTVSDDKTGKDSYESELIPSRGTWLQLMSDEKKNANGRVINMSIDRKRKIISTILYKAIGMSLETEDGEDAFTTTKMETFLKAMGLEVYKDVVEDNSNREYLDIYEMLFTSFFGPYVELINTLTQDAKTTTTSGALLGIYENQKSDEVATKEGAISLMNSKFFDQKKYDLTKAGRYKLNKKLNILDRMENNQLAEDVCDVKGKVIFKKGTFITKDERNVLKQELVKGSHVMAFPMNFRFSHPNVVEVETSNKCLEGRVLAEDVIVNDVSFEAGTVLTAKDLKVIAKELDKISVFSSITSNKVVLTAENFEAVEDYGQRLFTLGRLVDKDNKDLMLNDELMIPRYLPDTDKFILTNAARKALYEKVASGEKVEAYLVGSAQQVINVHPKGDDALTVRLVGNDPLNIKRAVTISDMYAYLNYQLTIIDGIGSNDDIDKLSCRRIRTVGELVQNQFRIGLSRLEKGVRDRMSTIEAENATPKSLTNIRPLTSAIREFFASSQLSQFMDQQNPLAELTNKRRISALGPGGLSRERASFEVRDVHNSHYGRICPIETPEGPNIGLISYLTTYAKINEYGFIETPYRKVLADGTVTEDYLYLDADEEDDYIIAQANEVIDGKLVNDQVVARKKGETVSVDRSQVELADVSPKQIVSV
ncbi:MAG: DNA-directed RNA polymerase subunit beta, partial [Erysipelotrichaceae bacterium]|nr:DNA-directed RNA polymerase subunit beta [Erysipelotrichaceae bacterium]